jgi:hypothetical protein
MGRTAQIRQRALFILIPVGLACGGGGGGGGTPPPAQCTVTISPSGLTLMVGTRGTLSARYVDGSGNIVAGVAPSWVSRSAVVASVDTNGTVTGNTVGVATIVATVNGKSDSASVVVTDDLVLEVRPPSATTQPRGTVQFTVVARNGAGQVVATPPVTWSSSAPPIATINAAGLATGVAKGITSITASARGVTSPPAILSVDDAAGVCGVIVWVLSWTESFSFCYTGRGYTEGGFAINGTYNGSVKATLALDGVATPFNVAWKGTATGTASLHETKSDPTTANSTVKLDGEGNVLTVGSGPGSTPPTIVLAVDLQQCTYRVTQIAGLNLLTTQPNGSTSRADGLVEAIYAGTAPLGTWANGLGRSGTFDGHSVIWAAHPDHSAFVPLGFSVQLMQNQPNEPPVGAATVTITLNRVP